MTEINCEMICYNVTRSAENITIHQQIEDGTACYTVKKMETQNN